MFVECIGFIKVILICIGHLKRLMKDDHTFVRLFGSFERLFGPFVRLFLWRVVLSFYLGALLDSGGTTKVSGLLAARANPTYAYATHLFMLLRIAK